MKEVFDKLGNFEMMHPILNVMHLDHATVLIITGLLIGMIGLALIVQASTWRDQGYNQLANFFFLTGLALIAGGGVVVAIACYGQKSLP